MSLTRSEQSRINGAKSKGPKTEAGKKTSSQNAIWHGLSAESVLLKCELRGRFNNVRDTWCNVLLPANKAENEIVEDLAATRWRMHRAAALQQILVNMEHCKQTGTLWQDSGDHILVDSYARLSPETGLIDRLQRHEDRLHRRFMRNLKALALLRQFQPPPIAPAEPENIFPQNEPEIDPQTTEDPTCENTNRCETTSSSSPQLAHSSPQTAQCSPQTAHS